jgi:multidrug transporter EmrE-like cation transporter
MSQTLLGIALVILSSAIEGFAQVCLKKSTIQSMRKLHWLGVGIAFFIVEALLYTIALQWLQLSTAYILGSLSFVAVTIFSSLMLNEKADLERWAGLGLILVGCTLVTIQK